MSDTRNASARLGVKRYLNFERPEQPVRSHPARYGFSRML
jgi:hypothetical protein